MTHRKRAERIHELMHGYRCPEAERCVRMIQIELDGVVADYIGVEEQTDGPFRETDDDPSRWGTD